MKKHILSYLTENYYLDISSLGNAGIYEIDSTNRIKVPTNAKKLIEEIVTIFGYSFTRTKWLIHDWAKSQRPDLCLKFYWSSQDVYNLAFPIARRVMASTVGQDLVSVTPMSAPTGLLTYSNNQYGELHHPTPNYMLAVDPATPDAEPTVFKVGDTGIEDMRSQRERTLQKWLDSGLLDNFDPRKDSIAALYEAQAKQFLK